MSLDPMLRAFYRAKKLRPETLRELRELVEHDATPGTRRHQPSPASATRRQNRTLQLLAAAALLLVTLAIGLQVADRGANERAQRVRQEVAVNHLKLRQPDFEAATLTDLREAMRELDFGLIEPDAARDHQLRLLGGRYCSIQGQLAAQLQYEDPNGDRWTLYQTSLNAELSGVPTDVATLDGVEVSFEQEHGVFLAVARGAGP